MNPSLLRRSLLHRTLSWSSSCSCVRTFAYGTDDGIRRPQQRQRQQRQSFSSAPSNIPKSSAALPSRRKRIWVGQYPTGGSELPTNGSSGLQEAYDHGYESFDEYTQMADLSPWVPLPDSVVRKVFDLAQANHDDIHVDLGAGDGRLNFHALDVIHVQETIGIDVDANILQTARDRLAKRHPQPTNIHFLTADLMTSSHSHSPSPHHNNNNQDVWQFIQQATLITMYFATPALERLRPKLEQVLVAARTHAADTKGHPSQPKPLRIVTCGYEMPNWQPHAYEVVLGTTIYLYDVGNTLYGDNNDNSTNTGTTNDNDDGWESIMDPKDAHLHQTAQQAMAESMSTKPLFQPQPSSLSSSSSSLSSLEDDTDSHKFPGSTVIDRTNPHFPIRGVDPALWNQNQNNGTDNVEDDKDDDDDWDAGLDEEDSDNEEKEKEENPIVTQTKDL